MKVWSSVPEKPTLREALSENVRIIQIEYQRHSFMGTQHPFLLQKLPDNRWLLSMVLTDQNNIPLAWAYLSNEQAIELTDKLVAIYEVAEKEEAAYIEMLSKLTPEERKERQKTLLKRKRFPWVIEETASVSLKVAGGKKRLNFRDYPVEFNENCTVLLDFFRLISELQDAQQKFKN